MSDQNVDTVPTGWASTNLGVLRRERGSSIDPARFPDEQFEVFSVPSFATGTPEQLLGKTIGSSKQTVEPGVLLVCKINPRINRVWVVGPRRSQRQVASTEWIPFFPQDGIEPEYLCHALRTDTLRSYLASNVSGVGGSLMRVRPAVLDRFELLVPPQREQRAIVAQLDSYLSRLDETVASLSRVQRQLKRYLAAVLQAAVQGKLVPTEAELARAEGRTFEPASELLARILDERRRLWEARELARLRARGLEPTSENWKAKFVAPATPQVGELAGLPECWCWTTVDQLGDVGTGATPRRGELRYWHPGEIPWVTSTVVNSERVTEAAERVSTAALVETNLTVYPPGTLLIAMYGEGKTRGQVAELCFESTTNQALAALILTNDSRTLRSWTTLALRQQYELLRRTASGGVQPNLNLSLVREITIPMPPEAEQARIVAEVERVLSVIADLERVAVAGLARCARLRQAILKWAFDGKLVDQDPTDEPASQILERIRAERATAQDDTTSRPRRRRSSRAPRS